MALILKAVVFLFILSCCAMFASCESLIKGRILISRIADSSWFVIVPNFLLWLLKCYNTFCWQRFRFFKYEYQYGIPCPAHKSHGIMLKKNVNSTDIFVKSRGTFFFRGKPVCKSAFSGASYLPEFKGQLCKLDRCSLIDVDATGLKITNSSR